VPFFWSAQQIALYYVGHASGFDEVIYDGAPEDGPFIAYYLRQDRLLAALGVERNAEMAALEELMRGHRLPAGAELRKGSFRPVEALAASR
jgi:apoptosis-inducing factor 3